MGIRMLGIDHSVAKIDIRTVFSFTKKKTAEALDQLKKREGIYGCVLLSTCNRMELWLSVDEEFEESLYDILCEIRELHTKEYEPYFVRREGRDAVEHLFRLSCGLESRILGEDQIITQVKDALTLAREHYATDHVLETLFRTAVTAAKKVKTNVIFSGGNHSVIHHAMDVLRKEGYEVNGRKCMVIGNGEMGKLAATVLRQAGADVTVTVRQYRSGIVDIPVGCRRIDYGNRMELLPDCDLVVSATASPNYTLTLEALQNAEICKEVVLVDLAVPRDIDPRAGKLSQIRLYDIDSFKMDTVSEKMKESIARAEGILQEKIEEFYVWYECRDVVPSIQRLKEDVAVDLDLRLRKILRDLPLEDAAREKLEGQIGQAAQKVANKMLFGLRDHVSRETFRECVAGLEQVYQPDQR